MTTMTDARSLAWDTPDRMRKSLRASGVSTAEMAEYLGVHPNSVGNWISGRREPNLRTLRLWALRTGVPFEWLRDGGEALLPHLDSNQEPFD